MSTRLMLVLGAVLVVLVAWLFRYDFEAVGDNGVALRLDRWTGGIDLCAPGSCR